MLYLLVEYLRTWLEADAASAGGAGGAGAGDVGPLRLFQNIEFRAVLAIVLSFSIVLLLGRPVINTLIRLKLGDSGLSDAEALAEVMQSKRNTPTMGGVLIVAAVFLVTLLLANLASFYVTMGLVVLVVLAVIGGWDDYLKLTVGRRQGHRQGLYSWEKMLFLVGLAAVAGVFIHNHAEAKFTMEWEAVRVLSQSFTLPFVKSWVYANGEWVPAPHVIQLPRWVFVGLTVFFISGFANAVNLTDGMDGLAGGIMVIVAFAFMILCIIAGYTSGEFILARQLLVPHIPFSDELAILAGAMMGACVGFLWFNCAPAQVFMGDTGSLALGGMIGYIAIVIRQEVLLLLIGGVFVIETASVILQVGYFKATGGRRVFKCAPIHHHFHQCGWTEQQVVIRFWLLSILFAALALLSIKLR